MLKREFRNIPPLLVVKFSLPAQNGGSLQSALFCFGNSCGLYVRLKLAFVYRSLWKTAVYFRQSLRPKLVSSMNNFCTIHRVSEKKHPFILLAIS